MFKRSHLSTLGMIALGGLLGYAAASERPSLFSQILAAQTTEPDSDGESAAICCSTGADRGLLLAQADANASRQSGRAPSAKESSDKNPPNILVIFGDDIGQSNLSVYTKEYPPRQRAATFSIDQAVDKMKQSLSK
jgi:hypothetical protein